jgi:hypothetical protein
VKSAFLRTIYELFIRNLRVLVSNDLGAQFGAAFPNLGTLNRSKFTRRLIDPERDSNPMSIQEVSAEQLAELFHHYNQALGPDFGCEQSNAETWEQAPHQEKARLVEAARLALLELAATDRERKESRRYFAKPGEAEWGC